MEVEDFEAGAESFLDGEASGAIVEMRFEVIGADSGVTESEIIFEFGTFGFELLDGISEFLARIDLI